ncbi:hypothetical protein ACUN8C_01760 [Kushneria sp. Sum13]|uniref:hypothetical protein n=1 Tax=Kushneria sp. Sum13 TaxID=3459196 RepID=UPI0040464CDA
MKKLPIATRFYCAIIVGLFVWICFLIGIISNARMGIVHDAPFLGWSFDTRTLLSILSVVFMASIVMGVAAFFIEKRFGPKVAMIPMIGVFMAAYWSPYVPQDQTDRFAIKNSSVRSVDTVKMYGPKNETMKALTPLLVTRGVEFDSNEPEVECPKYLYEKRGATFNIKVFQFDIDHGSSSFNSQYAASDIGTSYRKESCLGYRERLFANYDWQKIDKKTLSEWIEKGYLSKYYYSDTWTVYRAE